MPETGTEIVASDSQRALSPQQEAYVSARLGGATIPEALAKAGYAPEEWLKTVSDSNIIAHIDAGVKLMASEGAIDAILLLNHSVKYAVPADRVRTEAARAVLGVAGHVAPMRERHKVKTANLADMDGEGLRALVDQLQGELAARAKPVSAPNKVTSTGKALPFLD